MLHGQTETPVEITADGGTRFEAGVAIAEDNVRIVYEEATIFCEFAQFNPDTRDILLVGNVRIFQPGTMFKGERAVYNLNTKRLRAADFGGDAENLLFRSDTITSIPGGFQLRNSIFTTDDNIQPSWHLRARGMRIYPDDRVVLTNMTFKVGEVPIFWFPYFYQALDSDFGLTYTPGFGNEWGAFLLSSYGFPIAEKWSGKIRLDLRSERGIGGGLESNAIFGLDDRSYAKFSSYYIDDADPTAGLSSAARASLDPGRYRVAFETRTFVTDDMYLLSTFTALSDRFFQRDFFRTQSTVNPQPDNFLALTQLGDSYAINLLGRFAVNDFYTVTERTPELSLDIKNQPIFGSRVFYESNTSFASLNRRWAEDLPFEDYDSLRFDSYHNISLPLQVGGWLNVTPSAGYRATYYSNSGTFETIFDEVDPTLVQSTEFTDAGSALRHIFTASLDASFKVAKAYEQVQSRRLGLDGLMHVVQPYTSLNYVSSPNYLPEELLQFDSLVPSTQIPPIDPSFFHSLDSLDEWAIWRLGVRNRFITRRDSSNSSWLDINTYFDVNFTNPYSDEDFSNVVNRLTFSPVPWFSFENDVQLPLLNESFTEVNTRLRTMPMRNMEVNVGHRYLGGSDFFTDSSYLTLGSYYRINENWGFGTNFAVELEDGVLEWQRYTLHRDLTSWVVSLGVIVRDVGNSEASRDEFGVLLTFTLKDIPSISVPFNFDPGADE